MDSPEVETRRFTLFFGGFLIHAAKQNPAGNPQSGFIQVVDEAGIDQSADLSEWSDYL